MAAFLKYRNDASSVAIQKATDALEATYNTGKRVEFFGVGNSGIVAQDAQHKLFRLGVTTLPGATHWRQVATVAQRDEE